MAHASHAADAKACISIRILKGVRFTRFFASVINGVANFI
jgi:hypothetical protein